MVTAGRSVVGMTNRLNLAKAAPTAFRALVGLDAAARDGLEPALVELVRVRTAQLNGCAYCLHLHTSDARRAGESEERLALLAVWPEANTFYTERERAALALTDAVTLVSERGVPDEVWARAAEHFDDGDLGRLLTLICVSNTWNRVARATAKVPGTDERVTH